MAKEALSDGGMPSSYLFYEDEDSWHFKDLNQLLAQSSVEKFYYAQTDIQLKASEATGINTIRPYQKIGEIQYPKTKDIVEGMSKGYYDNELNYIDLIRRQYVTTVFKASESYDQFNHLGAGTYSTDNSPMQYNTGTSQTNYFPTEIGDYRQLPYIKDGVGSDTFVKNPRKLQDIYSFKISSWSSVDNIAMTVTIPGNTNLRIGTVVDIFVQQNAKDDAHKAKSNVLFGSNESAKFLITGIRHLFNKEQNAFHSIIRCAKDTYAQNPVEIV